MSATPTEKENINMERKAFNIIQSLAPSTSEYNCALIARTLKEEGALAPQVSQPDQADLRSMSWSVKDESGTLVARVVLIKSGGYSVSWESSSDGDLSEKTMENLQTAIASALAWGVL